MAVVVTSVVVVVVLWGVSNHNLVHFVMLIVQTIDQCSLFVFCLSRPLQLGSHAMHQLNYPHILQCTWQWHQQINTTDNFVSGAAMGKKHWLNQSCFCWVLPAQVKFSCWG